MGLFDHLFKNKPPTGEEKVVEISPEGSSPVKSPEMAPRSSPPQRADPSAFLHPKNYVPRGAPGLTPAPRSGVSSVQKAVERRTVPHGEPPGADEIVLTLGDVLSRIPSHYLKQGSPDAKRELRFRINDLSSDIARGRAAVPLSRIAQLVPDIFVKEIGREEDTEVRLPLQKLVEQIGLLRSRPKAPTVEKLPRPINAVEVLPAVPPVRPEAVEAKKEEPPVKEEPPIPAPVPLVAEQAPLPQAAEQTPLPAVETPQPAPIIFSEQTVPPRRIFEFKPVAESAPAPVILGPPPVVEPPPFVPAPVPPEQFAPIPTEPVAPAPAAPEAVQPVEPVQPVPTIEQLQPTEPVPPVPPAAPEMAAPEVVAPETVAPEVIAPVSEPLPIKAEVPPEPAKIEIDWAAAAAEAIPAVEKVAPPEEVMVEPAPAQIVEPIHAEVVAEATPPPYQGAPEQEAGAETIHLRLAAILKQCPPEIIVGKLPQVADSVRITLPFAPIDRQLIKGHVEVSSLRFVASLPEAYQKYFLARIGVKVPIPLEEIFQNLPTPVQELTPAPTAPPPVFLAPAASSGPSPAMPAFVEEVPVPPLPIAPQHEESVAAQVAETAIPAARKTQSGTPAVETPVTPPAANRDVAFAPAFSIVRPPTPVEPSKPERPVIDLPVPAVVEKTLESRPAAEAQPPFSPSPEAGFKSPAEAPVASASSEQDAASPAEPPKLVLQPPTFRPFAVPPPPIFGFAPPPPAAEEPPSEPKAPVEPPSLLSALASAPVSEAAPVEPPPAGPVAAPASEAQPQPTLSESVVPPVVQEVAPPAEPVPPPANDFEPSAELIASAPEDAAPASLEPHSAETAPHGDVADTLAHESTYAEALAEVVHIDEPYTRSPEPAQAAVAEAAPAPTAEPAAVAGGENAAQPVEPVSAGAPAAPVEHHAEPVVEGLAAAVGVAAVTALAAESPSIPAPEVPSPAVPSEPAELAKPAEAVAETATVAEPAPVEPPAAIAPPVPEETPPPQPHPLFPIPKQHVEHAPFEVLPPPSLPLRRFDQDAVQALFMTEETLDLSKISRLAAGLPGMYACVIATRDQACTGGTLPEGFDLAALLGLAPRVGEAAGRMPIGALKHFTLYGEAYSVSFFERNGLSLCAVHRPRSFVPGVREKLVALADELSR